MWGNNHNGGYANATDTRGPGAALKGGGAAPGAHQGRGTTGLSRNEAAASIVAAASAQAMRDPRLKQLLETVDSALVARGATGGERGGGGGGKGGVGVGALPVRRERECVMCMSDEVAVVFLPCSHQVVCGPCSDALEAQGMRGCPSCRTAIENRIKVFWPA